jgi:beta-galactosidase
MDPTRRVSFSWSPHTLNSYFGGDAGLKSQVSSMDVLNINYSEHLLEKVRSSIPGKAMLMTEAFVYYRGNGSEIKAYYERNPWLDVMKYDYLAGSFIWAGFDYFGEAISGWPMHGWNGSAVDATGHMRPVAFLHKSFVVKEPMVYIAVRHESIIMPPATKGHWDWPPLINHWTLPQLEGKTVRVYTFTNQPTVELTLNGLSKGKKNLADFSDRMMYWDIPYEAGTIRADCGSADNPAASYVLTTAGPAAKIVLSSDTMTIISNAKDVCHVEVQVQDNNGNLVPTADNMITFNVSGDGSLLAVGDGNLQSTERHQLTNKRSAFWGRALAVVKSDTTPGTITLTASASGLTSGTISIKTIDEKNEATDVVKNASLHLQTNAGVRISRRGTLLCITVPGNEHHDLCIIRADGTRVENFSATTARTHFWNTASVGQGVYFINARKDRKKFSQKVVVFR